MHSAYSQKCLHMIRNIDILVIYPMFLIPEFLTLATVSSLQFYNNFNINIITDMYCLMFIYIHIKILMFTFLKFSYYECFFMKADSYSQHHNHSLFSARITDWETLFNQILITSIFMAIVISWLLVQISFSMAEDLSSSCNWSSPFFWCKAIQIMERRIMTNSLQTLYTAEGKWLTNMLK